MCSTTAVVVKHSAWHFTADDRGYSKLNHSVIVKVALEFKFGMTPLLNIRTWWLVTLRGSDAIRKPGIRAMNTKENASHVCLVSVLGLIIASVM